MFCLIYILIKKCTSQIPFRWKKYKNSTRVTVLPIWYTGDNSAFSDTVAQNVSSDPDKTVPSYLVIWSWRKIGFWCLGKPSKKIKKKMINLRDLPHELIKHHQVSSSIVNCQLLLSWFWDRYWKSKNPKNVLGFFFPIPLPGLCCGVNALFGTSSKYMVTAVQ